MSVGDAVAILALLGGFLGGYVSVRVDLAKTRAIAEQAAHQANEAHRRIDTMVRR